MRNPLNKRLPREILKNWGKYLSIFILITATIAFGSSFLAVADSMEYTVDKDQKENHLEDGNFETYYELSNSVIDEVEKLNVKISKNYYMNFDEKDYTLRVYENRITLNTASLFEGEFSNNQNEIALDRLFAKGNDIEVGDTINVNGHKLKVTGLISLPDYSSLFKNNSDMMMDATGFGVGVVSNGVLEFINENHSIKYNYSYYFDNRDLTDSNKIELLDDIKECIIKENVITDFTMRENNQSITFLTNDMGSDVPMMKVLILIVIVIMAFIFAILSNNTIEQEAVIIGTLKASGYNKRELISHFMRLPVLTTLFSAIVGNLLGYTVLIEPFKEVYYKTYSAPPFITRWNLSAFIITTIIPILIMIVVNYFMLRKKLSLSPLDFLRKNLKKGKQHKAKKLPEKMSFKNRFRLRVIFQNKSSYFILFIGIFFASFLLMFALGIIPLLDHYVDTASQTVASEYQYILKAPIEVDGGERLTTYSFSTYYDLGQRDIDVSFLGIKEKSDYYKNVALSTKNDDIIISDSLANKLDIKIGDEIVFKDKYRLKEYTFKVTGIYPYKATYAVFMRQEILNDILEEDAEYFNSYLSNEKLDIDNNYVAKLITKEDISNVANQMIISFDEILKMTTIFAVLIYLVIIYVLTKVVIDKNAINISLMKVFGYRENEVRKLYLKATTYLVIIALLVCIPLEVISFKFIMKYAFSRVEGYLEFYLPLFVYTEIIAIGIVSYFLINSLHVRKIKKIQMNEALKNRE